MSAIILTDGDKNKCLLMAEDIVRVTDAEGSGAKSLVVIDKKTGGNTTSRYFDIEVKDIETLMKEAGINIDTFVKVAGEEKDTYSMIKIKTIRWVLFVADSDTPSRVIFKDGNEMYLCETAEEIAEKINKKKVSRSGLVSGKPSWM